MLPDSVIAGEFIMSLHRNIRRNAAKRPIRLDELGPNSREVAKRMIREGELLPVGGGYILNETKRG